VPASKTGLKKRGFNHVEILAKSFCRQADINAKVCNWFESPGTRKPQALLSDQARLKGISSRYRLCTKFRHLIKGKKILIIDDICTTGATFRAAQQLVENCQPENIDTLSLCRSTRWFKFRTQSLSR
jgi:competence protein ComFC